MSRHNGNGAVIERVGLLQTLVAPLTFFSNTDVNNADSNFNIAGKTFKRWTTQANGAGDGGLLGRY